MAVKDDLNGAKGDFVKLLALSLRMVQENGVRRTCHTWNRRLIPRDIVSLNVPSHRVSTNVPLNVGQFRRWVGRRLPVFVIPGLSIFSLAMNGLVRRYYSRCFGRPQAGCRRCFAYSGVISTCSIVTNIKRSQLWWTQNSQHVQCTTLFISIIPLTLLRRLRRHHQRDDAAEKPISQSICVGIPRVASCIASGVGLQH